MIKDRNKGIVQITYNHLNLPKEIKFGNNDKIQYIYLADGTKIQKKVMEGSQTQTTEYLEGFQYVDGELSFFPTAEGYVKVTLSRSNEVVYSYVYNYTDHLGNIRLRYTRNPVFPSGVRILEEDHYYPFGLKHKGYNNQSHLIVGEPTSFPPVKIVPVTPDTWDDYKYKYNGKEFQDELGLNFYDYGARNYDPALGRWMNVDPLAEKYPGWSPYNYVLGNPVRLIDPDGMKVDDIIIKGSDKQIEVYKDIVNKALGNNYEINVSDGKVNIVNTGASETMTEKQKAFYDSYSEIAKNKDFTVEHDLVSDQWNPYGGSFEKGILDIGDAEQFDLAGEGGDSGAGLIIHETVEQFEKAKMGLKKGEKGTKDQFTKAHNIAVKVQSKVQGNQVIESSNGLSKTFLEQDGKKTFQQVKLKYEGRPLNNMPIKVIKTKIK